MPETLFRVRWPDGKVEVYYSPSTVIKRYFVLGKPYSLEDFLEVSRSALNAASDRVREEYGMGCSRAMAQLDAIEAKVKMQPAGDAPVLVEAFSK